MNADLHQEVMARISEFGFKDRGGWLRQGKCPGCGKKELYTHAEHPWVLRCGRLNKCGYEGHVKDLFPELFEDWTERTKSEQERNPNAAADAYLTMARGFDLARIKGWYRQESYWNREANAGTATVRFSVGASYWERLIDRPARFGKKAHFPYGSGYKGMWWQPPGRDLAKALEIWITEGVFNSIALDHHDVMSASAMSSNNYPGVALDALAEECKSRGLPRPTLVWALDNDNAGRSYTLRWVKQATEAGWTCTAAQVPAKGKLKLDWNDLHQRGRLERKDLEEYIHHGALLIAKSPTEKGLLIYRHAGNRLEFDFDFDHRLYWFKLDLEAYQREIHQLEKADQKNLHSEAEIREQALLKAHVIRPIANCLPAPLYFQENKLTDESWYYYRVDFPHDAPAIKNTFTSAQLSSASEFKKRLLGIAPGAVFSGSSQQLERMLERQLYAIQRVETVDFIGYTREHGAYVFSDVAVKDGQLVEINNEDYYEFGKLSLKSLNRSVHLAISRDRADYSDEWVQLLWKCFGVKGMAVLAFWMGSLFAEQIRSVQMSYPFLEVVGEANAGKSTLLAFLWKLLGRRDYEGFDPSKSSLPARARNFAQVANMPVVLMESDRERMGSEKGPNVKSFDWDELKTAFNGRSVRSRGMATGGNETYEPPFRGAIVISQNNTVSASEPILTRICHLYFDRSTQTPKTREAAMRLEQMPMDSVSGWVLRVVQREAEILRIVTEKAPVYEKRMSELVKNTRIAKNHGQMAALADALRLVVDLDDEQLAALHEQIEAMAVERQEAISADHPIVDEFWETFEFLDQGLTQLNHSAEPDQTIAVNLNHFLEVARARNQPVPVIADLKKLLPLSKRYRYLEQKTVRSAMKERNGPITASTLWCWLFERPAKKGHGTH